jgi:hypothetical protein
MAAHPDPSLSRGEPHLLLRELLTADLASDLSKRPHCPLLSRGTGARSLYQGPDQGALVIPKIEDGLEVEGAGAVRAHPCFDERRHVTEQPSVAVFEVTLSGRPLHAHLVRGAEKPFDPDDEESLDSADLEGLGNPAQLGAEELTGQVADRLLELLAVHEPPHRMLEKRPGDAFFSGDPRPTLQLALLRISAFWLVRRSFLDERKGMPTPSVMSIEEPHRGASPRPPRRASPAYTDGLMHKRTKGQLEAEISKAIVAFEREFMGRGPTEVKTYVLQDMVLVRLKPRWTPKTGQSWTPENRPVR